MTIFHLKWAHQIWLPSAKCFYRYIYTVHINKYMNISIVYFILCAFVRNCLSVLPFFISRIYGWKKNVRSLVDAMSISAWLLIHSSSIFFSYCVVQLCVWWGVLMMKASNHYFISFDFFFFFFSCDAFGIFFFFLKSLGRQ